MAPAPVLPAHSKLKRSGALLNGVLQFVVRYLLAFAMMPYGISKLMNFQFQEPAESYAKPLGEASGVVLTWAFLGFQPWFQFLLGALEFVPSVLLLFRRTRRLGAVLLLPMLLNVALMNYAMNLWVQTRIISTILLAMDLYLLACDFALWRSWMRDLLRLSPAAVRRPRTKAIAEGIAAVVIVASSLPLFFGGAVQSMSAYADFIGDRQINGAGAWIVREFLADGQAVSGPADRFFYFSFMRTFHYMSGAEAVDGKLEADRNRHTVTLDGAGIALGVDTIRGTYRMDADRMTIDGASNGRPVRLVLERYRWGRQLPWSRAPESARR